jgi:phosphoribosylamine--glycine ligase
VTRIFAAPGNAGIAEIAQCRPIDPLNFDELIAFAKNVGADLTICGPETPLVAGIVDAFEKANLRIFGPNKHAARIEGSKIFAKDFMKKYNIPTAEYATFDNFEEAMVNAAIMQYPIVVKVDGPAAGKGVAICPSIESAEFHLSRMFKKMDFGASGRRVVIERFMQGVECTLLCFVDGKTIVPMVCSKDHKSAFDKDFGPMTGGMGAVSPNPFYTSAMAKETAEKILRPTMWGLANEGIDFVGVLYVGLMLTEEGPKVIEYNCRMGDPEAQAILPRLQTDLLDIVQACMDKKLDNLAIRWKNNAVCAVVAAQEGYPGEHETGFNILGLKDFGEDVKIFHAATRRDGDNVLTTGGRVLNVVGIASNIEDARNKTYKTLQNIHFQGMRYRKDIGDTEDAADFAARIAAALDKARAPDPTLEAFKGIN